MNWKSCSIFLILLIVVGGSFAKTDDVEWNSKCPSVSDIEHLIARVTPFVTGERSFGAKNNGPFDKKFDLGKMLSTRSQTLDTLIGEDLVMLYKFFPKSSNVTTVINSFKDLVDCYAKFYRAIGVIPQTSAAPTSTKTPAPTTPGDLPTSTATNQERLRQLADLKQTLQALSVIFNYDDKERKTRRNEHQVEDDKAARDEDEQDEQDDEQDKRNSEELRRVLDNIFKKQPKGAGSRASTDTTQEMLDRQREAQEALKNPNNKGKTSNNGEHEPHKPAAPAAAAVADAPVAADAEVVLAPTSPVAMIVEDQQRSRIVPNAPQP
ncbi:hypothetical protein SAMD00019534_067330 [Acytostelium subglobosum LB1]|uniref:hypothetical protein n=1 Tax=Acytostelium subglobosum LB1 TaxID=1410327 RepID=UPI0006448037|nr:hypothetical protein SAMD00019534_067330 [Acytostelium subglobosum LB1]GAM23558.1 hypothetical protein SAMD00019534_067330 [Acytostelium subglobosum LB1]|eukprot:XP_012753299.1 hypothetical protein SAMD00019534_067330 [Acytostelium subglobosum LB1]